VIFRDGADRALTVLPLTTFETQDPEKLWEWMASYEQATGGQVLAIPHNGNMSNGRMFEESRFDGSPMTREWAETRAKYEPLYEVTQIKGQSEAHPTLSPNDDFAAWDLWDRGNLIDRRAETGRRTQIRILARSAEIRPAPGENTRCQSVHLRRQWRDRYPYRVVHHRGGQLLRQVQDAGARQQRALELFADNRPNRRV
jgi:hypothetical protein